jgi:hypothetical protein
MPNFQISSRTTVVAWVAIALGLTARPCRVCQSSGASRLPASWDNVSGLPFRGSFQDM